MCFQWNKEHKFSLEEYKKKAILIGTFIPQSDHGDTRDLPNGEIIEG